MEAECHAPAHSVRYTVMCISMIETDNLHHQKSSQFENLAMKAKFNG